MILKHLPEGDGHLILLEAQSADNQGNQLDGYQAGEAAVIVRALASFHSIFWGSELLHGLDWLPQTTVGLHNAQPVQNAFSQAWEMLQRKSDIPIHLTPLIDRAVETYPDLLKRICSDLLKNISDTQDLRCWDFLRSWLLHSLKSDAAADDRHFYTLICSRQDGSWDILYATTG